MSTLLRRTFLFISTLEWWCNNRFELLLCPICNLHNIDYTFTIKMHYNCLHSGHILNMSELYVILYIYIYIKYASYRRFLFLWNLNITFLSFLHNFKNLMFFLSFDGIRIKHDIELMHVSLTGRVYTHRYFLFFLTTGCWSVQKHARQSEGFSSEPAGRQEEMRVQWKTFVGFVANFIFQTLQLTFFTLTWQLTV